MIDPHVHCRDGKQAYKATIAETIALAQEQGIDTIFDMPNTDPPILSMDDVMERLTLVPNDKMEAYRLFIGATSDENQLEEAVRCWEMFSPVIGIKMYAGQSVGDLAIIGEDEQKFVYRKLSDLGYTGVLAVHCEKEAYMLPHLWDPKHPETHSAARPKEAEIESTRDQISFAREEGFEGTLHIVHMSCPETTDLVQKAKPYLSITGAVTPHHLMFDTERMKRPGGLMLKMNPPLRSPKDRERMVSYLRDGKIDWMESDHAPHASYEKMGPPYASGFPSLHMYRTCVDAFLPAQGVTPDIIKAVTYWNIIRTFGHKLSR